MTHEEFMAGYTKGMLTDQLDVALDLKDTAVLVVDMLNDFLTPGGVMAMDGAQSTYAPIKKLTDRARAAHLPIIYVNDCHRENQYDSEFDKRPRHCVENSWGAAVVEELIPDPSDLIIHKRRYSGFFQSDLQLALIERHIKTVIITGVMTNICVRATAHDAFFLGYNVIVPEDCCAASCQREQESSLCDIATCYGLVVPSQKVIDLL